MGRALRLQRERVDIGLTRVVRAGLGFVHQDSRVVQAHADPLISDRLMIGLLGRCETEPRRMT